ncbi:protein dispatched homolog 1 [Plakobranchus ocellatus]|uniref:Protein dispatched homolog 1 n=1 Tax=Plakobranchus ocellatus TaxID=259542 RepID=A0AAV4AXU4_9GAST|nr:protein dispatched homolog 1 [Plakobranchus ocellatus]
MQERYARVLSHYPYAVVLVILLVVTACLVVSLTLGHGFDFEDPLKGFEPRGTELSDRLITYHNLLENVGDKTYLRPFTPTIPESDRIESPQESYRGRPEPMPVSREPSARTALALSEESPQLLPSSTAISSLQKAHSSKPRPEKEAYVENGKKITYGKEYLEREGSDVTGEIERGRKGKHLRRRDIEEEREQNETCDKLDKRFSRLIVTSARHRSLFNQEDLRAMCHLETIYLRSWPGYRNICLKYERYPQCCPAISLAYYVALLAGRDSCKDITPQDVTSVHAILSECAPFYHNSSLGQLCGNTGEDKFNRHQRPPRACRVIPEKCSKHNAVYNILHYLSDSNFMHPDTSSYTPSHGHAVSLVRSESFLKYSAIFLPVYAGEQAMDLFEHIDRLPRSFQGLTIVGAHFGVKYVLFEKYLVADLFWVGIGGAVIFLSMWVYTSSLFITIMAFLSIFWAIVVGYFLYTFVFKIEFFPYMNLVTLIVMIGIGADDLFIYCKVWHLAKAEKNNGVLEKIVSDTLRHTAISMLVTSFTSAAAFYANCVSDITSIRCCGVFAGTCIVINFVLTVTWLPASVMLHERWLRCCSGLGDHLIGAGITTCRGMSTLPYKLYLLLCDWSRIFFEKLLPCLVIKLRFVWIAVFGGLWLASIIVIFYYPRLKLPNSRKFQVFSSDHLSEQYDLELSELFDFERPTEKSVMPITVVWGVLPADNGDPLDPEDKGSLTFDPEFDLTAPKAQKWLLRFCARLRRADFYEHKPEIQLTDCFLENFVYNWMKQSCTDEKPLCCNQTRFPFQKAEMMTCLAEYIPLLYKPPDIIRNPWPYYGPRFNKGRISAFFIQFKSNQSFSYSYSEMENFYLRVNSWVEQEMQQAPKEMKRGWFVSSNLEFYSLQSSLAIGTPLALGVSLAVVALVAFFTTLNVLVSVYALLAVGGAISSTLATVVLLGWTLDILESIVITVAVGLAVDMTLHYGVAYRLAPDTGREMRVVCSLSRMGSPVSMAAATTMLAGAFMMPSTVLVFRKFGIFFLLLVSLAWLYSTFFFQSLLRIAGPHGGFGQFHWPTWDCCFPGRSTEHVDKTVYSMSESTLSSSSTSAREHSHGHNYVYTQQLEPLNSCVNKDRRSYRHHNCKHPCHKHHRHLSPQEQVDNLNTDNDFERLPNSTENHSSNCPSSLQNKCKHCHHHGRNSHHGKKRLKADYRQVQATAEVLTDPQGENNEKKIHEGASPSLSDAAEASNSDAVFSYSNGTSSRQSQPDQNSIQHVSVPHLSPHGTDTSLFLPTDHHIPKPPADESVLTSPSNTNSSTLSPSPHHANVSSSDLSEISDHRAVSGDSDMALDQNSGRAIAPHQVELLSHTQPVTVS